MEVWAPVVETNRHRNRKIAIAFSKNRETITRGTACAWKRIARVSWSRNTSAKLIFVHPSLDWSMYVLLVPGAAVTTEIRRFETDRNNNEMSVVTVLQGSSDNRR